MPCAPPFGSNFSNSFPPNIVEISSSNFSTFPSIQNRQYFTINYDGQIQIGNTVPNGNYNNYKLSVDGTLVCKRAIVQTSSWSDFVFQKNYFLMPLYKVEAFINKNKHLPNMPSETEIISKGLDISEIQKLQQAKIEELTLYIIKLEKEIKLIKNNLNK
jgi:hypothetical protein